MKKIKKLLLIRVNRVIHFVVKNVKTCHLISVTSKCNPKLFFSNEGLLFRNMDQLTVEKRVQIM